MNIYGRIVVVNGGCFIGLLKIKVSKVYPSKLACVSVCFPSRDVCVCVCVGTTSK